MSEDLVGGYLLIQRTQDLHEGAGIRSVPCFLKVGPCGNMHSLLAIKRASIRAGDHEGTRSSTCPPLCLSLLMTCCNRLNGGFIHSGRGWCQFLVNALFSLVQKNSHSVFWLVAKASVSGIGAPSVVTHQVKSVGSSW